jgi:hypothetical protein
LEAINVLFDASGNSGRMRRIALLLFAAALLMTTLQELLQRRRAQAPPSSTRIQPSDISGAVNACGMSTDGVAKWPRIFVYDLPPEFNSERVTCIQQEISAKCQCLEHCGYGPLQEEETGIQTRNTWQFSHEVIMHQRLLASRHRTLNADKADAFYVPYYSGLGCLCSRGADKVESILQWLKVRKCCDTTTNTNEWDFD